MPEEGGDGDDLMMGLEEEDGLGGMGMGMGMKGSLSPDSTEGTGWKRGGGQGGLGV